MILVFDKEKRDESNKFIDVNPGMTNEPPVLE